MLRFLCVITVAAITGMILDGTRDDFDGLGRLDIPSRVEDAGAPLFSRYFTIEVARLAKCVQLRFVSLPNKNAKGNK